MTNKVNRRVQIAVVGSGAEDAAMMCIAEELGRLIAEQGWVLITGGRDAGIMKAANKGAKAVPDAQTVGILPDAGTPIAADIDVAIITDMGEARNNVIVKSANVVVACGSDDPGTASEIALAIKAGVSVVLIGPSDRASAFFASLDALVEIARSPADAIDLILGKIPG